MILDLYCAYCRDPIIDCERDIIIICMNKLNSLLNTKATYSTTLKNSEQESLEQTTTLRNTQTPTRLLSLTLSKILNNRMHWGFQTTRLIPLRALRVQERMKKVIEAVFRRQEYQKKWDAFQNVRRVALVSEKRDYLHAKEVLKKQRGTAIRLLTAFVVGKKRSILHKVLRQIREVAEMRQYQLNNNYRNGLRALVRIFNRKMGDTLSRIRDSRVTIGQNKRLKLMFKIVKEIRSQNMRWAFVEIRREMLRNRCEKATEQIKELDQKLAGGEDEELKGLQDKFKELSEQLETVKKEKEDIQATLEGEIKQAENRNKEMKQNLERLKARQEEMKNKMVEIDEELKTPFSLQEIYQLCYQNLLWTVSQSSEKSYDKEQLLKSLETPLVPIDMPIEQLKEENQVLKDLLSEYVLMYGEKKLPEGGKLQLPYENLLKENNLLYKMLMTLLPNAQFLKEELLRIREVHEGVDNMVKLYNAK